MQIKYKGAFRSQMRKSIRNARPPQATSAVRPLADFFQPRGPRLRMARGLHAKKKAAGGGLSLSWMVLTRSTPKGEV
jgi:hypothetical protein